MERLKIEIKKLKELAVFGDTYQEQAKALRETQWVKFGEGIYLLQIPALWDGFDINFLRSPDEGFFPSEKTRGSTHYRLLHGDHRFYCLSGTAMIEVDGINHLVEPGESLMIPKGAKARNYYNKCTGIFQIFPHSAQAEDIEFL